MKSQKILLADDELALRFLISETLIDEGYDITEASDGQEAIDSLQNEEYDLIILDYMMPAKTGIEVCAWLRNSNSVNKLKPVLLLTAKALDRDKEQALAAGVTTYYLKPFSPLQLISTIKQMI
ncbi:response regulator [Paenibacillus psychroresistens]|uniref:Response regulator n=1 Tax=Paenibacillus psychroresistens TaxID=1778678 RepID=A0A6B8RLD9_9BACL|nr:response regulator [Paenibacillus psychroresistens]QGQ97130.1 response regulator [Paenibacillus psychroresistens]